jgi:hypothetical protein
MLEILKREAQFEGGFESRCIRYVHFSRGLSGMDCSGGK